jgi:hypothetical protein
MFYSASKIIPSHSKFRLLILFQSHRQALSWFIAVTLVFLIIYLISNLFQLKEIPVEVTFFSVISGSAFSLIFALKFEFFIHSDNENMKKIIIEEIYSLGYEKYDGREIDGKEDIFKQKGPTWLSWRESDLIIKNENGRMKIIGPLLLIWKIRNNIFKSINEIK